MHMLNCITIGNIEFESKVVVWFLQCILLGPDLLIEQHDPSWWVKSSWKQLSCFFSRNVNLSPTKIPNKQYT